MDPKGKGRKISKAKANQSLNAYKATLKNPNDAAYGHLFGLEKVQEFMDQIATYNKGKKPEDQIAGVRVYNCLDQQRRQADKTDVFLIPVLKNGHDLYEVNNLPKSAANGDDDNILGEGAPCPNFCDQ